MGVDLNGGSMIWMDPKTKWVVWIYDLIGSRGKKYVGSMIP